MSSLPPTFANPTDARKPGRPAAVARAAWVKAKWTLRVALVGVGALWSILLLLWLVLHWGILPHIVQWRAHIEMRASAALGVPVRIGDIQVRSSGWVPSVELRQVVLLDTLQRPALVLPRVVASLSPQSLLAWDLRFQQLYLEGAQLEVRRDVRGRVFVAGFDLDGGQASTEDDGAALRWFLKQPEFVIDGGSLRWVDEQRGAPPLALTDLRLVMRNTLRRHAIQLDATPPPGWGERFSVMGRFTQPLLRGEDFKRWSGTVHANLPRADVRELKRYLTLPVDVTEGDGALRAWVDLREGEPVAATVDLALRAVTAQLTRSTQPLALAQIEGRIGAKRHKDGVDIDVRQLSFQTGDGLSWPRGDLQLSWRQRNGGPTTGGQFNAQQLDIGVMAEVASALPLGEPVRKLLAEVRPQGLISRLALSFDGAPDAPTGYQVNGEVSRLSLASRPAADALHIGRPGLQNADVQFKATERGGEAQVRMAQGRWSFPGVFDEPELPLDEFSAKLLWQIDPVKDGARPPRLSLQVKDARFANVDAQGTLSARWSTGPGEGSARGGRFPGQLELDGQLTRGDAVRTARYLPRGIAAPVRAYVARAVRGGTIGRTSFRVKGDVWDFPYWDPRHARDAEFRIAGRVEDLTLAYLPSVPAGPGEAAYDSPWPALSKVSGELVFDRSAMEIRKAQARLGAVELSQINGGIANLASKSVLALSGVVNGPLADMLKFVNTTPVGDWIGQSLSQTTATGPAELKLALNLPLWDGSLSTVKGSLALPGNDLRIQPDTLPLGNARGRVDFTERGFTVVGATARVLGGDASFDGGTQADGSLRFNGQGVATADGLRRASELGLVSRVAGVLSGQAAYRVALGFVRGQPEVTVTSNLVGLAADLPAPLRKSADSPLALRYQTALVPDTGVGSAQPLRDTLRLDLGTVVQAQYLREYPRDNPRDNPRDGPRVLRGGVGINERAPMPSAGVAAHATLGAVDLDAWQAVGTKLLGSGEDLVGAPGGYGPQTIALRAQQLSVMERQLGRVVAGLSEDNGNWRANLDADELAGYLEFRPARRGSSAAAAGRVYARLGRLSLPKRDAERVETLLQQPSSVPALDIVVDDLELRGKKLGRVEIDAINRSDGGAREWQLRRLALSVPEARLVASGSWRPGAGGGPSAGRPRAGSVMDFKLDLGDSGAFLERMGAGRAIRGGKGTLAGQVHWQGSPLDLDYASLSGQVNLAVASGQFLKAEPGAARLLGVLSLQSLPRRLALDFRDVFQQGFAFDSITGDVEVAQGVARTNNLLMRGVQAAVLMEGQADVQDETQDLRVVVVPEINAGTASLAYAAINPAVGLGTFLAQLVLRKPLVQAGTREFHVTGPWGDPKVERVERKLTDPVPSFDAAPASAPAAGASAPTPVGGSGAVSGNAPASPGEWRR